MGWFPADQRGLALGMRQTAIPIGGAAAAAGLPWLADSGGTRLAFIALGCSCIGGAVVAAALHPRARRRRGADLGERDRRRCATRACGCSASARASTSPRRSRSPASSSCSCTSTAASRRTPRPRSSPAINVLGIVARILVGPLVRPRAHAAPADAADRRRARRRDRRSSPRCTDAPLALLIPALVVAGGLSMAWNGLAFAAAAETASAGRVGAAIGFQQTLLGLIVAGAPPAFAAIATGSWRLAFALAAVGPVLGVVALGAVPEPSPRGARSPGTSALPPAAR